MQSTRLRQTLGVTQHAGEWVLPSPPAFPPPTRQKNLKMPNARLLPSTGRQRLPPTRPFLNSTEIQKAVPNEQIHVSGHRVSLPPTPLHVEFLPFLAASHPDPLPCLQKELPRGRPQREAQSKQLPLQPTLLKGLWEGRWRPPAAHTPAHCCLSCPKSSHGNVSPLPFGEFLLGAQH